jgi:hypothetical protein
MPETKNGRSYAIKERFQREEERIFGRLEADAE